MVQLHEIRADFHSEDDPVDASSARFHEKNPEDSGLTVTNPYFFFNFNDIFL